MNFLPFFNFQNALQKILRNEEAIVCYQNTIQIDPNHKRSHYNLGLIFANLGEHEKAINHFNTTISLDQYHKDSIFEKGLVLLGMGELHESQTMFDKVLEIDSKHQRALSSKGFALSMLGNYELSPDLIITISKTENQLKVQLTGQSEILIFAKSNNVFNLMDIEAQLTFNSNVDGKVESLTLFQGGQQMVCKRMKN